MIPTKEELSLTIDESEWGWLRSHLERGGLVLVDDSLDLAEAAISIAADDTATIETWISGGKIGKPTEAQVLQWNEEERKLFSMLIVSPFVLIKEKHSAAL
jgi:hypothetical protein